MKKRNKVSEKGIPYGAREHMPAWYGLAWSSRGISAGIAAVLMMQITYYCTDILGLSAIIVGEIFLVSKIIDAFTDLAFGFILDKTHTKLGKARPYELFIVAEWFFTALMFSAPNMSKTGLYIWIFIMYVLVNAVCATALGGIDSVYMSRAFTTQKNQISAMSINGVMVMFVSIIFNIIFPSFLAGAGKTRAGWVEMIIPLAIVCAIIGILRFIFCKEIVIDEPVTDENGKKKSSNTLSFKESMKLIGKNKYLFLVVGMMMITFIVNNMNTAQTYYFKYIFGNVKMQGTIAITSMVVIPAIAVFPALSKKFGTTKILQACSLIGAVGLAIRTIGGTNVATLFIGSTMFGIGTLPISMMINTYLIDCMDYGEWKTGTRVEGLIASIANFASKVGNGIALGVIGLIMGLAGYNGKLAVQSASANTAIIFLYNIFPMILFILMFILAMNYRIDTFRPQMNADLKAKHEAEARAAEPEQN